MVTERFLNYVRIDTQSMPETGTVPSTEKQRNLAALLADEMQAMGLSGVRTDEHGYVYAELPATPGKETVPVLGLIAHMDTSPAVSGKDVRPKIIENYNGGDILLNAEKNIVLSATEYPELLQYKGQDIIVTDGTTLLGADDKAGIAEIMTLCERLIKDAIPHGTLKIAFTPDEEVGGGIDYFDVEGFGADFAYTVDGGALGEIEYENFNAASLKLIIHGRSTHTGDAKNKMKNALMLGIDFINMLPAWERPEHTEGYEGFYHLDTMKGDVEQAELNLIIRDHDRARFEDRKARVIKIIDYLNEENTRINVCGAIQYYLDDTYYNMKEKIEPHMHLIANAEKAMEQADIVPKVIPIRGGTDGAKLSYRGIPCPNLCTGGHNYHGRYEFIPVQSMEKIVEMLIYLVKDYTL